MRVSDIRAAIKMKHLRQDFVIDKSGVQTVELQGVSFLADEPTIFGNLNTDYAARELEWYRSESLYVEDIPGETPKIWNDVASEQGHINSNYGFLIWSKYNHHQYKNAKLTLQADPGSRRASMIYQRPTMHLDYKEDGMNDFICSYGVDYHIRNGKLDAIVHMRSNDVVFGYKNDRYWQLYVQHMLADDLGVLVGNLHWSVSSLHLYERHFGLLS